MKNKYVLKYSTQFYNDFEMIISYIKYELKNVIAANNLLKKWKRQ